MRSESFMVPRSAIRAPFYNSALTLCQGLTAADGRTKVTALSFLLERTRGNAPFAALTETEGFRNAGKNRTSVTRESFRSRQHASRVCSPEISLRLAKMTRSATYAFQFLTFTCDA